MIKSINSYSNDVETTLNKIGAMPVAGIISGSLRVALHKTEAAVALVFLTVGILGILSGNSQEDWKKCVKVSSERILQCVLNIFRGLGEIFLAATGLNIVTTLPWQLVREEGFAPVIKNGALFT